MPLTPTAATGSRARAVNSWLIAMKSAHHTARASCSTQPGCGMETSWARVAVATTLPSVRTSTPLELAVPISTPSSNVTVPSLDPTQPGPLDVEHPAYRAQLGDVLAGHRMDVVSAEAGQELAGLDLQPGERVRPLEC
jgi:hypothetical protein